MRNPFPAALLLALALVLPARATTVLPLDLDNLVAYSALAFEGVCVANRTERDPQSHLVVTYTTFEVRTVLEGAAATTHVIKQVGGDLGDGSPVWRVASVPKFVPGRAYVVFLAGVSAQGFSSPLGLSQGVFEIAGETASATVGNGRDLRELAENIASAGLPGTLKAAGPVTRMPLAQFEQLVRERAAALGRMPQ